MVVVSMVQKAPWEENVSKVHGLQMTRLECKENQTLALGNHNVSPLPS